MFPRRIIHSDPIRGTATDFSPTYASLASTLPSPHTTATSPHPNTDKLCSFGSTLPSCHAPPSYHTGGQAGAAPGLSLSKITILALIPGTRTITDHAAADSELPTVLYPLMIYMPRTIPDTAGSFSCFGFSLVFYVDHHLRKLAFSP